MLAWIPDVSSWVRRRVGGEDRRQITNTHTRTHAQENKHTDTHTDTHTHTQTHRYILVNFGHVSTRISQHMNLCERMRQTERESARLSLCVCVCVSILCIVSTFYTYVVHTNMANQEAIIYLMSMKNTMLRPSGINLLLKRPLWSRFAHHQIDNRSRWRQSSGVCSESCCTVSSWRDKQMAGFAITAFDAEVC
jgi:hypothetical protein